MDQFNKNLMAALVQKQDLNETFHQYLEQAINDLLQHELAAFLGYEPYDLRLLIRAIYGTAVINAPLRPGMDP